MGGVVVLQRRLATRARGLRAFLAFVARKVARSLKASYSSGAEQTSRQVKFPIPEKSTMLERLLSRQPVLSGVQILAALVAASFTIDLACAQSPGVMGVYKTANSSFGGGMGGQAPQGINAYGTSSSNGMQSGPMGMSGSAMPNPTQGTQTAQVEKWESIQVDAPEYVYRGHEEKQPITSLTIVPFTVGTTESNSYESYAVLSASCDKTARVWQLEGKFDPETTEFFVTNGRQRKIYKDVHKQGLTSAVFSPDYKYVLTSSYDAIGRLWRFGNQENIRAYLGAKDRLWAIAVADSGQYVAGACNDGRIYFWESLTVKKLGSLPNREDAGKLGEGFEDVGHEGPVFDVAFSPDSSFVATAGADGTVRIWNLSLQRQVSVIKASEDKVYSVRFSSDGAYLLTASRDKTARLFNATTGEEVCRYVGHTGAVRKAEFAGNYIATCSDDQTARLWTQNASAGSNNNRNGFDSRDPAGGPGPMTVQPMMAPSVSEPTMGPGVMGGGYPEDKMDGRTASSAKPTRKPGKPKGTELACFHVNSPTFSVAVSSDQVYLVTGSADGLARVWRVPGNSRHYGDSSSNGAGGMNGNGVGSGFGDSPLADPTNTIQMGGDLGGK